MNQLRPSRPGPQHFYSACVVVCASLLFATSVARAQDVTETARQEKARKAGQKQQPHVYTNDDLQRTQILTPEDRGQVEARKKNSSPPVTNEAAAAESLGEIARRLRREKAERQAEQASKIAPPSLFHMDLPAQPTLAHPKPLSGPLVAPSAMASKTVQPSITTGSLRRDPFSRAAIAPAPQSSIVAPALKSVVVVPHESTMSPVVSPAVVPSTVVPKTVPRSLPVESKNPPNSVRVQLGDSLWILSRQYLGKGSRWQEWLSRNPQLGNPLRLQPGVVLLIPGAESLSQPRSERGAKLQARHSSVQDLGTVSVHPGDSLWTIAAKQFGQGSAWQCLARANPDLPDVDRIFPGQVLVIPNTCGTATSSSSAPTPTSPTN